MVLRVTFSLFVFFGALSLLMLGKSARYSLRSQIQNGYFAAKVGGLLLLLGLTLLVPEVVFKYFGYFSLVGGCFFYFIQIVVLVDWAYDINDNLVMADRKAVVLAASAFLLLLAIAGIVLLFVFYAPCTQNQVLISVAALLCVLFTVISILEKVQRGALLTSALVAAYVVFLTWSALVSLPAGQCQHQSSNLAVTIVGLLIMAVTTSYSTLTAALLSDTLATGQDIITNPDDKLPPSRGRVHSYSYFHLVFASAACYVGMVLTNWMSGSGGVQEYGYDSGYTATWIKLAASWLTVALYLWSLLGPLLCPSRDWS